MSTGPEDQEWLDARRAELERAQAVTDWHREHRALAEGLAESEPHGAGVRPRQEDLHDAPRSARSSGDWMYSWLPLFPYLGIPTVAIVLMHFGVSAETAITLAMAVLAALIAYACWTQ